MHDKTLKLINRGHDYDEFLNDIIGQEHLVGENGFLRRRRTRMVMLPSIKLGLSLSSRG